jgi:hypothetical protein
MATPSHTRYELIALGVLLTVGAVLLFARLGDKYLWQDEASTAVLGSRLLKTGKPISYNGVNIMTLDHFGAEDPSNLDERTQSAQAGVQYYVDRGDFKEDTTWIAQPWGSFLLSGISTTLFGESTLAARIPFAAAGLITVWLLYWFVRREFKSPWLALLASFLLIANVFWIIHSRQCRYYVLSSLFLVLTLITFTNWQNGKRFGGAVFVFTAWCWFQVDFGSFWPVVGILFSAALIANWPRILGVFGHGVLLSIAIAPFVWYYELFGRLKSSLTPWSYKFLHNLFHFNQFIIPIILLAAAIFIFIGQRRSMETKVQRLLAISVVILLSMLVWIPSVVPHSFHRYIVHYTPLAALVSAWVIFEISGWIAARLGKNPAKPLLIGTITSFLIISPVMSDLVLLPIQLAKKMAWPAGEIIRSEWKVLREEIMDPLPDPNRLTIEALAQYAAPGDEILMNYEDFPMSFYTRYKIRGGVPAFRVGDPEGQRPRFLVYRPSVPFIHEKIFMREIMRYKWNPIPVEIPDFTWGNMPEPEFRLVRLNAQPGRVIFAENLGLEEPSPQTPIPRAE